MMNAVYAKSTFAPRVVWPPEAMAAHFGLNNYRVYTPRHERKSFLHWSVSIPILGAIAFSLALGFALIYYRDAIAQLGQWGYLGIFFVEMANSATILLPTPGQTYAFALGFTLNPFVLGLIGGVGSALGELTGYYVGTKTGNILQRGPLMARLQRLTAEWGGPCLFLFAAIPAPFEIAGLWAGTVRYPILRFLFYVALGKILKVTAFALAGYYSLSWFLD